MTDWIDWFIALGCLINLCLAWGSGSFLLVAVAYAALWMHFYGNQ